MTQQEVEQYLGRFTVGIAGAGGLGSNCAVALARCGIGKIVIADFDTVSLGNLNRQYYFRDQVGIKKVDALATNIGRINPGVIVEKHDIRLDSKSITEIFGECDIIVEAFDDADMKEMIVITVTERLPGMPLVIGSGMAGWGQTNILRERRIDNTLIVCGDEQSEVSAGNPPLAPRVGIVANMQANTVVDILMSKQ